MHRKSDSDDDFSAELDAVKRRLELSSDDGAEPMQRCGEDTLV